MTEGVPPPLDDAAAAGSGEISADADAGTAPAMQPPPDAGELTGEDIELLMRAAADANSAAAATAAAKKSARSRMGSENGNRAPAAAASDGGPSRRSGLGGPGLELPEFSNAGGPPVSEERISMLSDVNLNVKIELGRTRMLIEDVLRLDEGSVVELDKLAGDPVDVFANDRLIARGEVLVLNDSFCVRISEVFAGDPHRVV